jgi:hypothetical protein
MFTEQYWILRDKTDMSLLPADWSKARTMEFVREKFSANHIRAVTFITNAGYIRRPMSLNNVYNLQSLMTTSIFSKDVCSNKARRRNTMARSIPGSEGGRALYIARGTAAMDPRG